MEQKKVQGVLGSNGQKVQGGWTYSPPLITVPGVKTRVPNQDDDGYLRFIPGFTADDGTRVEGHWSKGLVVPGINGKSVICFRHFYGITEDDFGKNISSMTEVIEKRRGDEVYILINHHKTGDPFMADIRFAPDGDGIPIHNSRTRINIIPRRHAQA